MTNLVIVHINVYGLRTRLTELNTLLAEADPPVDLLLLNETKLNGCAPPLIPGFTATAVRDRQDGRLAGGGVAIYSANNLQLRDISPEADDIVAVELEIRSGEKIAVISYYVPPQNDINPALLDPLLAAYPAALILGDLNAKHQFFGCRRTNQAGELLFNIIEDKDLTILNNPEQPTHYGHIGEPDIIDFAIATRSACRLVTSCDTWDDVGSDHLPLKVELHLRVDVNRYPVVLHRPMSKCDWPTFASTLDSLITDIDDSTLHHQAAVDERGEALVGAINNALDIACPKQPIRPGMFRVSAATLALIKHKRKIRRLQQTDDPDPILKTAYNSISRRVKAAIAKEKREAWQRATEELNHLQGAKLWKKFNSLTGGGKASSSAKIIIDAQGQRHSGDQDVANAFADHLEEVHKTHQGPDFCQDTKEAIEMEVATKHQLFNPCFPPAAGEQGDDHFLAEPVLGDDVLSAVRTFKTKTSPGSDGVTFLVLKRATPKLLGALAQLFTVCLLAGYFPLLWKTATGVMIHKPGKDRKSAGSYRPISLLSCVGKLFEKVISLRLNLHLREIDFFNNLQRAYRSGLEGGEHLYRLTEELAMTKKRGFKTALASLDVEKAFDSVWHDGIRHKLSTPGTQLPAKLIRLLSNYLSGRTIKVKVGQATSRSVTLQAGTPQGSVLSPTLFNMYVNDIPLRQTATCDGAQFADDVSTWASAKKKQTAMARLQISLRELEPWLKKWRIKVNAAKTQVICFNQRGTGASVKFLGQTIVEGKSLKLLGATFDRGLSYREHCTGVAKKAMNRVNLLKRLRGRNWGVRHRKLLNFYKQFVRPVMENGYSLAAMAKPTAINSIQVVQNSALRVSLQAHRRTRIADLHKEAGIPMMKERVTQLREQAVQRYQGSQLIKLLDTRKSLLLT